jgi:hypothetical protein
MRQLHLPCTILVPLVLATSTFAQTNFPEIEPNSDKAAATPVFGIVAGDAITGTTTGAVTTTGSTLVTTVDTFRVKTAALPPGLYQHRLTLTSATVGHTGSIRSQGGHSGTACTTGGTVVPGDGAAQTSLTTSTPPRYNQWYGFGAQEELYYRVEGTGATTAAYAAVLSTTPITPTVIAPAFDSNGPVTISTVGLTTVDTEIVLYDAAGNLVGQNDNECPSATSQSRLTRTLAPGTYYVGVSTYELCVSQPAPPDDGFFGVLIDFPGCVALSFTGSTIAQDWDFEVHGCNGIFSQSNQSALNAPFTIPWYQITVSPGAPPISGPPANDNCASAAPLSVGTINANIGTASHDGTASCDTGGLASKDLWYAFTASPAGGLLGLSTCGSVGIDTVVTVFSGCGGSELACNDDCGGSPCGGPTSCISGLALSPNQVVLVRVSDKGLGGCEFRLTTTFAGFPPPNDDCTAPTTIAGFGNFPIDNFNATTGTQGQTEPLCSFLGSTAIASDIWYTWTSTDNGTVELTTCGGIAGGPSPDSKIAVYDGAGCPVTPAIACNEDSLTTCTSHPFNARVFFTAVCGNSYTFQMGMYPFTTLTMSGTFSVTLTTGPSPCSTPSVPECFGDTAVLCPCSGAGGSGIPNPGAAGNGCANSSFPAGAHLTSSGNAVDNPADSLVLTCTNIPGPGLFFQSNAAAGPFINFNDGTLCAAIGIIRMGVVFPTAGVASYPGGLTPAPIHTAGAPVLLPTPTKHYQCWYRDITPGFCNTPGHNMSNGLAIVWTP